jgi:hypothetical protein
MAAESSGVTPQRRDGSQRVPELHRRGGTTAESSGATPQRRDDPREDFLSWLTAG